MNQIKSNQSKKRVIDVDFRVLVFGAFAVGSDVT
jgi:hypothetical protein